MRHRGEELVLAAAGVAQLVQEAGAGEEVGGLGGVALDQVDVPLGGRCGSRKYAVIVPRNSPWTVRKGIEWAARKPPASITEAGGACSGSVRMSSTTRRSPVARTRPQTPSPREIRPTRSRNPSSKPTTAEGTRSSRDGSYSEIIPESAPWIDTTAERISCKIGGNSRVPASRRPSSWR